MHGVQYMVDTRILCACLVEAIYIVCVWTVVCLHPRTWPGLLRNGKAAPRPAGGLQAVWSRPLVDWSTGGPVDLR